MNRFTASERHPPHWSRTLTVGVELAEPAMTFRLLEALRRYEDFEEVRREVGRLRRGLGDRDGEES